MYNILFSFIPDVLNSVPVGGMNATSQMAANGLVAFMLVPVCIFLMLIYFYFYLPFRR